MSTAIEDQEATLKELLKTGKLTEFGKEHGFHLVTKYEDYKHALPIRDYELYKPYIK